MATKKKTAPKKKSAPKKAVKKPAKKAVRKAAPKKAVKKVAKKAVKKAVKKPAAKKTAKKPAKKAPARKALKKAPVKKVVKKVAKTAKKPAPSAAKPAPAKPAGRARAFRKEELANFRAMLQKQLDLVQGNLNALAGDNLKRSPLDSTGDISTHSTHMADHGTDNFDRELALSLASSRQDSIYDIEDAIRRIDEGEYGTCESCGKPVERPRLKALPFAKKCVACQNAAERGRSRFQPFVSGGQMGLPGIDDSADSSDSSDS